MLGQAVSRISAPKGSKPSDQSNVNMKDLVKSQKEVISLYQKLQQARRKDVRAEYCLVSTYQNKLINCTLISCWGLLF